MAWNVVIAGGGFGGAMAARELERILPRQSTRLILVNDVNFLLYTPFLPEAAAGTLEPRHVVTPLRDLLDRTRLRLGSITAVDPARNGRQVRTPRGRRPTSCRYDRLVLALGSVSRVLPIPGLAEHGVGFKSLADAIWLRNHVIRDARAGRDATDDAPRREELLTYVFVGGGYAGPRGAGRAAGLRRRRDRDATRGRRLHGMRWILVEAADRVLPRGRRRAGRLRRCASCAAAASTSGSARRSRR